jgi:polysaccharide biosynthesis transport protein
LTGRDGLARATGDRPKMEPMVEKTETDIGEYLSVLRRRWAVIVGTVVMAMVVMAAIDLSKTPVYKTSAQLLLQPKQSESIFQPGAVVSDPTRAVQNELKIINSQRIRRAVAEAYGRSISVSAVSGGEDDVIILSATDTDPEEAARKVNVYTETYQTERLNALVADLAQSKRVLQQQINDFQGQIDALNRPLAELDAQLAAVPIDSPQYLELVQQRDRLDNQINTQRNDLQQQLGDYQQRLQILQLSERLTTTGGVQILNPATVPSSPVSPNIPRDLAQAALIGLFLGIALAFLLEQLDDSVRSSNDLERATRGLPVLGLIPFDVDWKNRDDPRLITSAAPMSVTSEAYRGLRTSLQYLAINRPMGVVQVTSPTAGEGKSSTLANLAMAFADAGMKVAVVGCDLRRPRIHQFFRVNGAVGLTSVLLGSNTMEEALQRSPVHPNISVLPSGPRPPNPSELLSVDRTAQVIRSLLATHAIVFVDCPPVLPVTDSLVLSRAVDASIFVAMASKTSKRAIKHSIERLRQVNSPVIGTILNGVSAEGAYESLYEYYGYAKQSKVPIIGRFMKPRGTADVPSLNGMPLRAPRQESGIPPADQPSDVTASSQRT